MAFLWRWFALGVRRPPAELSLESALVAEESPLVRFLTASCADWGYDVDHPLGAVARDMKEACADEVAEYQVSLTEQPPTRRIVEEAINMRFDSDSEFAEFKVSLAELLTHQLEGEKDSLNRFGAPPPV